MSENEKMLTGQSTTLLLFPTSKKRGLVSIPRENKKGKRKSRIGEV
jgi:hypothetical protein